MLLLPDHTREQLGAWALMSMAWSCSLTSGSARDISGNWRRSSYAAALINELRARGATTLIATEIDAYVDDQLVVPVPAASATMDNGIPLRQIELRSSLHRLISVLKSRQMETDPAIRGFTVTDQGIVVESPFAGTPSGFLTGHAVPVEAASGNEES